ncbi:hypothetical protein L0244_31100 [bacterium]|nr:hypothetical protein [bacterium]
MKRMCGIAFMFVLMISSLLFAAYTDEYPIYLRMLGFSKDEVNYLQNGRMVTHSIENRAPGEFGIIVAQVYNIPVYFFRDYLRYAENYGSLLNFEQIGKFKQNPDLQDLRSLRLSDSELKEFLNCRSGSCNLSLTPEEIKRIPDKSDLTTSEGIEAFTDIYRRILLSRLMAYRQRGIRSFSGDGEEGAAVVSRQLVEDHLYRFPHIQAYFPRVHQYILEYPKLTEEHPDEFFYWTKESLGSKPIINIRHVFSQRVGEDYVQVSLLVYSSHSYLSSIGITHLINYTDIQVPRTLVVTEQRALTNLHGSIVKGLGRNVLRSNLEKRVATWVGYVGKAMENRYLENSQFPYGLLARDQR